MCWIPTTTDEESTTAWRWLATAESGAASIREIGRIAGYSVPSNIPFPPSRWLLAAVIAVGVLTGFSLFTFDYAEGMSYFSNDPAACVNCHIMRDQYDGWNHSSHKAVAACNDCHAPHTFPDKWIVKGVNGFNHSVAFTFDNFHEPIRIREMNVRVALDNCVECHDTTTSQIHVNNAGEELSCLACHQEVGHAD